jgi:rhamnose utilization protein RhaD (predicted bifunctional aldolase and dehydrogenase)
MLSEYVDLCRLIGAWPDWVQGPGGNCSLKEGNRLIVKRSGALIADTTDKKGWVCCDISQIQVALQEGREDIASTVLEGDGKPSIEAFLHTFPPRIIVHLHPSPLMGSLCSEEPINYKEIPNRTIPYLKPGIPLTRALQAAYDPSIPIYFLKNHGIIFMGSTTDEILDMMLNIQKNLFDKHQLNTNIQLASKLYRSIKTITGHSTQSKLIRPYLQVNQRSQERIFFPYSPDIAVFLQKASLVIEDPSADPEKLLSTYIKMYGTIPSVVGTYDAIYIIGSSMEACNSTYEILMAYYMIPIRSQKLTEDEYDALVNWDKEKARKA